MPDFQTRMQQGLRTIYTIGLLGLIWLVVLPWVGERETVRKHIQAMEQARIDPSAMYYSELKTLEETEAELRRLQMEHPELLWKP